MSTRTESETRATAPAIPRDGSYVDWPAILAGSVVGAGIVSVFSSFGAALGFATISPYEGEGSAVAALLAVGTWMVWTTVSGIMAGGYVAGRMRRRVDGAAADEVGVRDGIHGLAVWGVSILIGIWLIGAAADTAAIAVGEQATSATQVSDPAEAAGAAAETAAAELGVDARTARNYSILSAFVTGASLFVAAAGAYWAAGIGGRHRDENRAFAHFGAWK